MAKVRTYMKAARSKNGRIKVEARTRASHVPIYDSDGRALPTAAFALDLDIPDIMFQRASEVLAEVVVDPDQAEVAAEVKKPSEAS